MAKQRRTRTSRSSKKARRKRAVRVARRPVLVLTTNGQAGGRMFGPRAANDVRIVWNLPVLGGGGYWTKNGKEIPGTRFVFLHGTNDLHFSPTGRFRKGGVPLRPPPGANDIEIIWDGPIITEAWWTRNGERFQEIPLEPDQTDISVDWS